MPDFISQIFTPAGVTAFIAFCGALFWLSYHHPKSYNDFIYPIGTLLLIVGMVIEIILWTGYHRAFYELVYLIEQGKQDAADKLKAIFLGENNWRFYCEGLVLSVMTVIRNLELIGVVKPLPGPPKDDGSESKR